MVHGDEGDGHPACYNQLNLKHTNHEQPLPPIINQCQPVLIIDQY